MEEQPYIITFVPATAREPKRLELWEEESGKRYKIYPEAGVRWE